MIFGASQEPGFYLWQGRWNDTLTQSVLQKLDQRKVYYLAWELRNETDLRQISVPAAIRNHPNATPVFRADATSFCHPERLLEVVQQCVLEQPTDTLQLDIDIPESQLTRYGDFLRQLRARIQSPSGNVGIRLSVTLLPVHLKQEAALREIATELDFAVLQLHGIDAPQTRADSWQLMNPRTVETALQQLQQLALPIPVALALPTYAYLLEFEPDGKFKRLYAERFPELTAQNIGRFELAQPNLALIAEILQNHSELPVIWFRFPAERDRWTLDWETIEALERRLGAPESGFELRVQRDAKYPLRQILEVRYRHNIVLQGAQIVMLYRSSEREGEFFPLGTTTLPYGAPPTPGRLPDQIVLTGGACGQWTPAAIFLTENQLFSPSKDESTP